MHFIIFRSTLESWTMSGMCIGATLSSEHCTITCGHNSHKSTRSISHLKKPSATRYVLQVFSIMTVSLFSMPFYYFFSMSFYVLLWLLQTVFCTVCKYVLSICKFFYFFFCTVWSTLIRISLTKARVLWWCDNKSDLIYSFTHLKIQN